ncbi:Na+/melibiose symporter-like transporter [Arthrobacter sp. UYCu712]
MRETQHPAETEAASQRVVHSGANPELNNRKTFTPTSFRDKSLSSVSQTGMVNNLNDGLAWGLFPVFFPGAGLSIQSIGILAAVYPAVWGAGQLVTGALSDRIGRKPLIAGGMLVQAVVLLMIAAGTGFETWLAAAILLGAGTAMVSPTPLAAIGDVPTRPGGHVPSASPRPSPPSPLRLASSLRCACANGADSH